MGAWGVKVFESDQALDAVDSVNEYFGEAMARAAAHEHDVDFDLMALIECYIAMPIIDRDAKDRILPYLHRIEAENFEQWTSSIERREYVQKWVAKVNSILDENEKNPFHTSLLDKITEGNSK